MNTEYKEIARTAFTKEEVDCLGTANDILRKISHDIVDKLSITSEWTDIYDACDGIERILNNVKEDNDEYILEVEL